MVCTCILRCKIRVISLHYQRHKKWRKYIRSGGFHTSVTVRALCFVLWVSSVSRFSASVTWLNNKGGIGSSHKNFALLIIYRSYVGVCELIITFFVGSLYKSDELIIYKVKFKLIWVSNVYIEPRYCEYEYFGYSATDEPCVRV